MFFFHFWKSLESNLPREWNFFQFGQRNAKLVVLADREPSLEVSDELDPNRYKNTSDTVTQASIFQLLLLSITLIHKEVQTIKLYW